MVTYNVFRDGVLENAVFDVAPLTDTANPFGDFVVVKIDDRGGVKFDEYARGTNLEVLINPDDDTVSLLLVDGGETVTTDSGTTDNYRTVINGGTYDNAGTVTSDAGSAERFDGYVVERREGEQQGSDTLEIEAYSFDQFLRRNTVSTDLTGKTIPEALESIVDNDSPVTYTSSKVEVVDDQELTRSFRGEPVEEVLRDLAFKSGNENFGVDDSLEFFFRPRESVHIDRGIDNTQWIRYDIPELGKEVVNEVEVWYNDGNESVIVDAPTDKLDLQDNLGLANPGTQRAELQRPQITDTQDAEDVGRRYLQFRNATLSGTVTTYGLYEAEPGDTIDIEIKPRGIDTEFVIASVEYRWGVDETTFTIVEKRGDQDDILFELNDSVKRQELEGADRDAPSNRVTTTNTTALFDVSLTATKENVDVLTINSGETVTVNSGETITHTTYSNAGTLSNAGTTSAERETTSAGAVKFVNPGRNAVRDAWSGQGNPDVSTITVGSDSSGLSRSNTDLANQTNSASTTQSLPDSTTARYEASITQTDVQEVGLETSGGTLIARASFNAPVDLSGTVQIDVTVSNDDSVSRGVLTNDGQTAVRDVLADNNPALPTDYAYGSDGSAVSELDASLGNELVTVALDSVLTQDADTNTEWSDISSLQSDDPIVIKNGEYGSGQAAYIGEAEDNNPLLSITDSKYSGGEASGDLESVGDVLFSFTFSTEYRLKANEWEAVVRHDKTSNNGIGNVYDLLVDGKPVGFNGPARLLSWERREADFDLPAGQHTLTMEITQVRDDKAVADVVGIVDNNYNYNFDNTDLSTVSRDYLKGPELFPDGVTTTLDKAKPRRNVSDGSFDSTWKDNNVSGAQAIEIAPDGSTFTTFSNTTSGSYSFSSPTQEITTRFTFDRYGSRTTATPTSGFKGQAVDLWELFVNPDTPSPDDIGVTNARAIVAPNSGLNGETVREAGLKSGSVLLTRHQLAEFVVAQDQRLASSEQSAFKGDN